MFILLFCAQKIVQSLVIWNGNTLSLIYLESIPVNISVYVIPRGDKVLEFYAKAIFLMKGLHN